MDRVVKGIVMEIATGSAVLMTNDGEFVKVKRPQHDIALGDEITSTVFTQVHNSHKHVYAGIAALILLLLIPFTYFKVAYATVAYVNVDINPSLELGINRFNKVNDAVGLNSDGVNLLKDKSLKGLDIKDALNEIITGAKDEGYIDDNKDNNIEVALVKLNPESVNINEDSVMQYIKDAVVKSEVDAAIEVRSADKKIHDNAKKENMSTNKYMDKTQVNNGELKEDVKKSDMPANSGSDKNNKGNSDKGKSNNNGNSGNNGTNGSSSGNGSNNSSQGNSDKDKGSSGKDRIKGQGDDNSQSGGKMETQGTNPGNNGSQEDKHDDKPQQGNKDGQKDKK